MQTFLPYPSFAESAKVLDRQRLGKQRVEVLQILRTLTGISDSWKNHPAVLMWQYYKVALALYGLEICDEWTARGYKDTCLVKIKEIISPYNYGAAYYPFWLGDENFHASHRAALLYKDYNYYSQFGWEEKPAVPDSKGSLPYVWPVKKGE